MAVLAATGCHGCREDHPYVPYAIGSGAAEARPSAPLAPPPVPGRVGESDAGDPFAEEPARAAPAGATHWSVDGLTLDAADGQVLWAAAVGDFDGDGAPDAFVLRGGADGKDPGELAFYRPASGAAGAASVAATFAPPPGLVRDPTCVSIHRLGRVGPRSVAVELGARCPERPSSAPARWLAVVDGSRGPAVRIATTIADPTGAPDLGVRVSVADRDGDGRDDVALEISLEGGGAPLEPGPRVSAVLAFLDRPAGLSRDAGATEASFAQLAASASARAVRAKEAGGVPGFAAQARALWRAACADGGSPRVLAVAGTGAITCGGGRALEDLALAEVRAYATLGDPLRAALALDHLSHGPSARTPPRMADAQKWITQLAPASASRLLRAVAAVPLAPRPREISWGALAFEASGKLLVRTRLGVVRVDPDAGDEAASGTPDWAPAVSAPDGASRWIEAYDPCDGLPLRATFELASGTDARDLALPVPAPLAGRCAGSRGAVARALPIAWGPGGLEAIVEGEPVLVSNDLAHAAPLASFLGQPTVPGAPRSPNGKAYVVPTAVGFVVLGAPRARTLRDADLDGTYAEQHDCVVSDDATHVACVRGGRAWVGTWDAR
jgi:hypothetical protein